MPSSDDVLRDLHVRYLGKKMLNTRTTIFYRPDLDGIYRDDRMLRVQPTAMANSCVSSLKPEHLA
ncbi:hypothetical protein BM1_09253 [Bipolaris maydis]|uniref:uncharacterized protein n=1 Tax=Cochliobolus heterostrophus TaxID=5016 RepID=UPI0024CE87B7|nr:hypothetical protein BM1_09253 [Bipolaris maydis]KAJ5030145.1 hypothetical protein J3E73DRAFT_365456 [Bipolaris maydis]KAJ6275015.1 hypothetical protein PSV08DRAFT_347788 [Bipolaris maydis]KAJ6285697.1 hypothetical protein J3E71DRAFT_337824 [Bipolaris maydis]